MSSVRVPVGVAAVAALVSLSLAGAVPGQAVSGKPTAAPATFTPNVRADAGETGSSQNEPQVTVDQTGMAYVAWQSSSGGAGGASGIARTLDGVHVTYLGDPDHGNKDNGDTALATTSWTSPTQTVAPGPAGSQAVFFSELGRTVPGCPAGAINIRASYSEDRGGKFTGTNATCQPAQVDRNWIAAYTDPKYRGTPDARAHTWVYQEYHDFAISMVWLTVSSDGGTTWDTVNQHPAEQGNAIITSACNVTPGGVAVDQNGAHAGRVYVAWTTTDAPRSQAEGCNITEAAPFTHVYISYSDDHGATWTSRVAWNDPCAPSPPTPPSNPLTCADNQAIFTPVAVDDAGNVYVAFADYPDSHTAPSAPQFDVAVAWSSDGGDSWSGGSVDNPGTPRIADSDVGTHYFPWLAAAGNGAVDVVWYGTPEIETLSTQQKPTPASANAVWNVYMGQSLDVIHGAPFVQSKVSNHDIYFGDICTVGIFCSPAGPVVLGSGADRTLYDDFGMAIGPDGGARIAWTDARDSWNDTVKPGGDPTAQTTHVYFACQQSGRGLHGEVVTGCGKSELPVSGDGDRGAGVVGGNAAAASTTAAVALPNTAAVGAAGAAGLAVLALLAGVRRRGRTRRLG